MGRQSEGRGTPSIVRDVSRNVLRWQNGGMALRWTVTGLIEAEKRFKRIRGYRALPILSEALQQKRGLDNLKEAASNVNRLFKE